MIIPTASLTSKLRGKTLQYHGQLAKDQGRELFSQLVQACKAAVRARFGPTDEAKLGTAKAIEAHISPDKMFLGRAGGGLAQDDHRFSTFDEAGFPTTDDEGTVLLCCHSWR